MILHNRHHTSIERNHFLKRSILLFWFVTAISLPLVITAQTLHRAVQFDGTNDYIDCGTMTGLNLTSAVTISLWVKFDALPSAVSHYMQLAAKPGAGQDLDLQVETDNKIKFFIASGLNVVSTTVIQTGKWYHVAATYAGGSSIKLYVNGILESSTNIGSSRTENSNHFAVGTNVYWPNRFLQGTVNEVRLYTRALPIAEIQQTMCKTLTGGATGLVGYWRLDEASDSTCSDLSGQNHPGLMKNMDPATDRILSSAPLGDESAYDYTGSTPSDFTASLAHSDGDTFAATGSDGTVAGIQVYRVDETPMRTGAAAPSAQWTLSNTRYWGVFCAGSSPTCSITYHYQGNPSIINENDLGLAVRSNYAQDQWSDASASLNTGAHTLTVSSSSAEFSLGSKNGSNPLPVELVSFSAAVNASTVTLRWTTATEVNNHGFEVERKAIESGQWKIENWQTAGFVEGNGSSNSPVEYSFFDYDLHYGKYSYRLKQIDRDGHFSYSQEVEAAIGSAPQSFELHQNFPNPFNPSTSITFTLPVQGHATLKVYDVIGREAATLMDGMTDAGTHTVQFNASSLAGGIYLYRLTSRSVSLTKTMILLK